MEPLAEEQLVAEAVPLLAALLRLEATKQFAELRKAVATVVAAAAPAAPVAVEDLAEQQRLGPHRKHNT